MCHLHCNVSFGALSALMCFFAVEIYALATPDSLCGRACKTSAPLFGYWLPPRPHSNDDFPKRPH